jgi:prophage maintenance system killer protein
MKNDLIVFENQEVKLDVNIKDDTVWLNTKQLARLFSKEESNIRRHIINIFNDGELERESNVQKMHVPNSDKLVPVYNLDVIISVGYRVKSKNGIIFRRWANKVLKDYLLKGYAVNQRRLEYLEKTVKLIDIATRVDDGLENSDAKEVLKVISSYSKALDLLDDYDHRTFNKVKGKSSNKKITYESCIEIINKLKFNNESKIFALERDNGLKAIIGDIYQTFDKKDVYKSIEEKASNFLYMIIKNHVFIDGNKRIGATLFIYFLQFYNILYKDGRKVIDNNTLTALTLLIAQSNPKEKDLIIDLVMNFLE